MEIVTTAPDPSEPFAADARRNVDLSRLHRVDLKGLGTVEMENLMRVAMHSTDQEVRAVYEVPLWGPPGTEETVFRVPPSLVEHLAGQAPSPCRAPLPALFANRHPADLDDRFDLCVEGTRLFLEGLDAVDGSPVLDIKPWVREFAPRGEVRQPAWTTELMRGYWSRQ